MKLKPEATRKRTLKSKCWMINRLRAGPTAVARVLDNPKKPMPSASLLFGKNIRNNGSRSICSGAESNSMYTFKE